MKLKKEKSCGCIIAKAKNEEIIMQENEIENIRWCSFEEALNTLTFNNWKEMFKKVMEDLN